MEIVLSCQHSLYRDNLILIPHTKPPSTKSLQSERQIKITSEMEFCTNDALYGVICLTWQWISWCKLQFEEELCNMHATCSIYAKGIHYSLEALPSGSKHQVWKQLEVCCPVIPCRPCWLQDDILFVHLYICIHQMHQVCICAVKHLKVCCPPVNLPICHMLASH